MPKVAQYFWDLTVNGVLSSPVVPIGVRVRALRMLGVKVGRGVRVRHGVNITSNRLSLGDNVYVNVGAYIQNYEHVDLRAGVAVAPRAVISSTTHATSDPHRRQGALEGAAVVVGEGSWVGAMATVLSGVTIGRGVIVAAGAVVVSDCDDDQIYAGVPARPVKSIDSART